MKRKIFALVLALSMTLCITACGGDDGNASKSNTSETAASETSVNEIKGLTEAIAEQPILLTSCGQSADYQMVGTLMKNANMDYEMNALATSADLGDAKTLVVVVGGSSKGLGAAGIDADGELKRVNELLDGAEKDGLTIIAMHTGGTARRGELSDKFVAPVFERAQYAVVVKEGDNDQMMSKICADKGIPMDLVESITDVATVLPKAFK